MLTLRSALIMSIVAVSFSAWGKDSPGQQFIGKAIQGNLAEVAMGQLAQQQASRDDVREFGKALEQDHSAANQQATTAAESISATVPTEPSKKQKADYDKMAK